MRPRAVLGVRPDKVARVCAWCPDKDAADEWAESRGYEISHGMCDACKNKMLIPAVNTQPTKDYYDDEIAKLEEAEKQKQSQSGQVGRCGDEQGKAPGSHRERQEGRSPSEEPLTGLWGNAR